MSFVYITCNKNYGSFYGIKLFGSGRLIFNRLFEDKDNTLSVDLDLSKFIALGLIILLTDDEGVFRPCMFLFGEGERRGDFPPLARIF